MPSAPQQPYQSPLQHGILLQRYKRFLADVRLDDGQEQTTHCVNPGRMTGCSSPGSEVLVEAKSSGKLAYRLEQVRVGNTWIGVNPQRANRVVEQALRAQALPALADCLLQKAEATLPGGGSRIDFLLHDAAATPLWLEVKSVTYVVNAHAMFPDAVTARGRKHLLHLSERVKLGERAAMLFLVQRNDARLVGPAAHIDPAYAEAFAQALAAGVEVYGFGAEINPQGIALGPALPVRIFDCAPFADEN